MASTCLNNSPAALPPYRWLNPKPDPLTDSSKSDPGPINNAPAKDLIDFEFRLHDDHPVAMHTADELFSDGKLVPLQLTSSRPLNPSPPAAAAAAAAAAHPSASSPKAPKCSSRWREILGLKKKQADPNSRNPNPKSIKNLLHRNPRSASTEPSLSLPLLRDSDSDSISLSSSRLSLSSTSSSSDSCDLPRLSLDFDKPARSGSGLSRTGPNRIRTRPVRRGAGADAESPRMNSSGKVVFYSGSLERSSSSPGSFNGGSGGGGGPRVRARGMERSYSANVVRVNPVLNVPVCSLRNSGSVFGFFSGSKKEKEKNGNGNGNGNGKVRSERASRE